jgi:hypothetical protein
MGKVCRGGYIITWWKGDHEPRHVHVKAASGRKLGRIDITAMRSLGGWTPDRKLIEVIQRLKSEGRI